MTVVGNCNGVAFAGERKACNFSTTDGPYVVGAGTLNVEAAVSAPAFSVAGGSTVALPALEAYWRRVSVHLHSFVVNRGPN
jgi:hypothetical protein